MAALPKLPHAAIMEVLARLPVKSIKRFKCACRFWFSLLSSPKFVQTHLDHLLNVDDQDRDRTTKLLTVDSCCPHVARSCPIHSVFASSSSYISRWAEDFEEVPHPLGRFDKIIGTCNGLFCLVDAEYSVLLWNPSTRESRKLPPFLRPPMVSYFCKADWTLGFGYDHSADDYKVVRIDFTDHDSPPLAEVFSLKAYSWKSLPPPSFDLQFDRGTLVGGSLNWIAPASTPNGTPTGLIKNTKEVDPTYNTTDESCTTDGSGTPTACWMAVASFHLATEKFQIGPPFPFHPTSDKPHKRVLSVLRGCLCLIYQTRSNPPDVHVWIMKEYGKISSWSLEATLTYPESAKNCFRGPRPLYLFKDVILMHQQRHGGMWYLFDLKRKSLKLPIFFVINYAEIYVETLVSPYGCIDASRVDWDLG